MGERGVHTDFQPLGRLMFEIDTAAHALEVGRVDIRTVVEVVERHVVLRLVRTAVDADVILLAEAVGERLVKPVVIIEQTGRAVHQARDRIDKHVVSYVVRVVVTQCADEVL